MTDSPLYSCLVTSRWFRIRFSHKFIKILAVKDNRIRHILAWNLILRLSDILIRTKNLMSIGAVLAYLLTDYYLIRPVAGGEAGGGGGDSSPQNFWKLKNNVPKNI